MADDELLNEDEIEENEDDGTVSPMNVEDDSEPDVVEPETPEEPQEENNNTNNRRKKIMKYGLKEVADVIFFDIRTKKPVLVFDTYLDAI